MTTFSGWLEANGQDPRTFVRDTVFLLVKFTALLFVIFLPVSILVPLLKPLTPPGSSPPNTVNLSDLPPQYVWLVIPFALYILCAVLISIALIGGWHKLARSFRAPEHFEEGQKFKMQSARVGLANYNNILTVRVAPQGLYLSCPFPFRLMHPPLLIPWSQITLLRQQTHAFGRVSFLLSIGKPKIATIMLVNKDLLQTAEPWLSTA